MLFSVRHLLGYGFLLFGTGTLVADISGTVFRDLPAHKTLQNVYGQKESNEQGVKGVTVTAYDNSGATVSTTTTDATGAYTLTTGAGKYRIEFTNWPSYLQESPDRAGLHHTSVQFANDGATIHCALFNPADYAASTNPKTAVTMFALGLYDDANASIPKRTINIFDYNTTATEYNASNQIELNHKATTGAIYGVAYDRTHKKLYTSALLKRHSGLGVGGLGALYQTDLSTMDTSASTTHFVDIPNVISGTLPARGGASDPLLKHDDEVFGLIGHVGLGDIDISEDDTVLYVVNLHDKKVYTVSDLENTKTVREFADIPDPSCVGGGFRPFALKVHDNKLYAGGVCDANVSHDRNDLKAYVYVYDLEHDTSFNTTPVLNFDLNYTRDYTVNTSDHGAAGESVKSHSQKWYFWSNEYNGTLFNELSSHSYWYITHGQPQLRDIEFDDNNNMIIGLQSRTADQLGSLTYRPGDGVGADEVKSIQAGDILKATQNPFGGGWTIEPHVSSGGSTAEFYTADRFRGPAHLETAFGALAHLSGTQETIMALMDPCHDAVSGGARRISDLNGSHVTSSGYGIEIYSKYAPGTFGKSGGIGDIELLTAAAPVEIGDRVWLDSDSDGIQDASESGLAGVTVQLLDNSGSIIAEVNTSANGNYVFSNDPNGTDNRSGGYDYNVTRLHPNSQYTVRIPHVTGSGKQAALGTHVLTIAHNAAGINADLRDSNGILSHTHADAVVVTNDIPLPGSNNHHFDFGFTPSVAIGNRLFFDNGSGGGTENNGIQDGTEPGVSAGVKVELYNDSNVLIGDTVTDGNGRYYFDTLAPGKYYVKIPASEFGTGKPLNKYLSSTGADTTSTDDTHENGQDNDHPETNGIVSNVFTLTPGSEPSGEDQTGYSGSLPDNSVNATDDFGLIQLRGSWSGNVSQDTNNDDIGDKMLSGVEIKLYTDPNGDGDPADGVLMGTTTTDSNGNYRFTHLAPGNYVAVETQPTGLVNVKEDEGGADNDQGNNHIINAIAGYVDAGEEDTRNDFVEEDPNTAYRIGDLFWVDADKDGEYDSGEEVIAGATIELLTVDGQILRTTTTDANGRYHFDVPAGKYKVRFHIPKKYLDKGYKFVTIQKDGDETNKADADGLVEQAVEVGPGIATQNLTLDAAINCPCSKIQGDSADTLNIFFAFLIIMGTLILMYFEERESNLLAV